MEFLGYKLRSLREAKKLSMLDLEEITGVSQSVISDLENGKKKTPRKATVDRLCKGLKIEQEYFYLENSRLPTDVLPDLPEDVKKFIMSGENTPYLIITEKAKKNGISPEVLDRLLEALILNNGQKK